MEMPFEQPEENFVEVTLKQFDELVEKKKQFDDLMKFKPFVDLILGDFIEGESNRLKDLLMSRNNKVIQDRDIVIEKLVACGVLKNWIETNMKHLEGIDNPAQREALIAEAENYMEQQENESK